MTRLWRLRRPLEMLESIVDWGGGAGGERNEPDTEGEHSNLQTVLTMMATETSPPIALLGWASCLRRDTKLLASPTRMLRNTKLNTRLLKTFFFSGAGLPESANGALKDTVGCNA